MTEATQDEALRLADWHQAMAEEPKRNEAKREKHRATAAELRRQHALLNSPELLSFRDGVVQEAAHHREKAVHHCITTAAACANWHAAVVGKINMRPGAYPSASQETNGG